MSSVGKFVHDSNKAPDSPPHPHTFSSNQRHCFHCKDVLGDGEFCQRCTCVRCGSGLSKGLCLICASRYGNNPNLNSLNDSPNISENVSQSPPLIDHHCCYGCGDSLDFPIISNPKPCNNQIVDELPQTLPSFDPTCYFGDGSSFTYDSTPNFVDDSPNVFNPSSQPPTYSCEFYGNDAHYGYGCPPQVLIISNPEPCYNQDFNFPQNFQVEEQAANIDQSPPQEMSIKDMEDLKQHYLNEMKSLINDLQIKDYRNVRIDIQYRRECEIKIDELKQNFNGMSIEIRKKEKELLQQEQAAYVRTSQRFNFIYYDDDDDEESSITLRDIIISELPSLVLRTLSIPPSESDGISESECDLPVCDDSSSKKDEVLDDIISIPPGNGNDHFNAESSLIEFVLNRDNVIFSPKIEFLLEEFAGELALIAPIPPGIVEADFDPKGDIRFIENLIEDIDLFEANPPILTRHLEAWRLLSIGNPEALKDTLPTPSCSSMYYEVYLIVNSSLVREFHYDVVGGIGFIIQQEEPKSFMCLMISGESNPRDFYSPMNFLSHTSVEHLFPVIDTLLPFSSENEDKVVNPGILVAGEEKSPHLLSHWGFKAFQLISESPMMIYGGDISILDISFLHYYPS
ncbi:hypothetical protein Tco_0150251 [Tanacetum coccineum]